MTTLTLTIFPDFSARTKVEHDLKLCDLADLICRHTAPKKDALPWLKLARFGERRTSKGSLRHNANMLAISGIEADYDGEKEPFEYACDVLEKQGISSIVYTSPSYTEDAPRWRVLCPFSAEAELAKRDQHLGRLNGLFRGIFANESWILSQAYYFGRIGDNPSHQVKVIDGTPIDQQDDLDEIWRGKPGAAHGTATPTSRKDTREDAELICAVVTGDGLHVEMCTLATRFVGRRIPRDTVAELLRGLMISHPEGARDHRWYDRYHSIPELVESAVRKFVGGKREVARDAFRLLRRGLSHDAVLATLQARNKQCSDPLPDAAVAETAQWAAQQMVGSTHAV
jgi:hypothetical protein